MNGIAIFLIAGLLAGCASDVIDSNVQAAAPPNNYRQLAADKLPTLKDISLIGAEISGLSRSIGGQLGDWTTCLKTHTASKIDYFAVFFYSDKKDIIDTRRAILTDRCELAVYSLLPSKSPTKPTKDH